MEYAGNRIQRVEQRVGKESVDYIYLTYILQKQDREIDLKSDKITLGHQGTKKENSVSSGQNGTNPHI